MTTDDRSGPGRTIAWLHEEINPHKTAGVRDLGPVDVTALRAAVLALPPSAWDTPDDYAANYNKRGAIRSAGHVTFRFSDRRSRPARCFDLPSMDQWQARLWPVMEAAVGPLGYARGFFPRIMLALLPAGAFIAPHTDGDALGTRPHKIHVPLVTNRETWFFVADQRYHLDEGRAYEVNNSVRHAAANNGATDRIHLIFEYLDADLQRFAQP